MSDDSVTPTPPADRPPLPDALRPNVALGAPDEAVSIYEGPISFSQSGKSIRTDAIISLRWLPTPAIHLDVPRVPDGTYPQLGEFSIQLDDGTVAPHGLVTGIPMSMSGGAFSASFTGIINDRVVSPADGLASYVMFLLPNFDQPSGRGVLYPDRSRRASRLTLRGGGWIINLDAADDQKNVEKYLEANSGFGITQVGRLEKADQAPFSAEDSQAALRALAWYISFAAGRWTGPCLPTGFDAGSKPMWQVWEYSRTVSFRRRTSWMDRVHGDQFEEPFPGFMKLWLDDTWEEVIRLAIHWYIEANALAGSVEGSIVLTQTSFELLASAILVDHDAWLSQDGCDRIAAADRIRLLFLWAGIPTGIPDELGDLVKLSKSFEDFMLNKTPDAAAAMTTIRNTITHPTRKNREKFGRHTYEARNDAWTLGLRNLELCLLKLFDHRGTYADRIGRKWQGEVEPVPWK
jgi:hypothetical protein